ATADSTNAAQPIVFVSATGSNQTARGNSSFTINPSTGNVTLAGTLQRTAAGKGYLDGQFANVETASTTGPIYTIGGAYIPTSTSLNTMYGIGYSYNFGFTANTWGLYVCSGGAVRHYLDSDNGISYATGSHRSPIFYDYNNTGYYVDPASTSNLALTQTFDLRALGQVRATGWYGQNSSSWIYSSI
ncbi:MAG: hypothetical protein EBU90_27515, partial [Proteobacteria bacterium]|nr:hypothetical protein [Pseudomonadota bacterium]